MKKCLLIIAIGLSCVVGAQQSYSFSNTDTMRAVVYYSKIGFSSSQLQEKKYFNVIGFEHGALSVFANKKSSKRYVAFTVNGTTDKSLIEFAKGALVNTKATKKGAHKSTWYFPFETSKQYQFMIHALPDSAERATIYTAYVHLPETDSWKLISAIKKVDDGGFLKGLNADNALIVDSLQYWVQTDRGRWNEITKETKKTTNTRPQIDWSKNYDSAVQAAKDLQLIYAAVAAKKTDTTGSKEGVYYSITKEGNGRQVKVTDTVTVHYKGSLLADGSIFDQTKGKPTTFPLNRLIKGWQIAIPMCKVGGSVRVIIPSALAYSIRTRSKSIPPNSVLVFDIEVVDAKPML